MSHPAAAPIREGVRAREVKAIVAPWLPILAGVAACLLAGAALEMVPPFLLRSIVDQHLAVGKPEGLFPLALLYLAATAAAAVTGFLVDYLTATAAQSALRDLRVRLFAHLQGLPLRWFDRTPLGDTISRCTADVDTIDTLFSSGLVSVASDLFRLISISIAMVVLSPFLTLVATVVIPPVYFITRAFRTRVRDAERDTRKATGMVNVRLQEYLGQVEVIRAFGRERAFAFSFVGELKKMLRAFNRSNLFSTFYSPLMAILSAFAAAVILYAGASGAVGGVGISVGTIIAFVLLFQRFFKPIIALGDDWQTVQGALAGLERIRQVLAEPAEEVRTSPRPAGSPALRTPVVDIRNVEFSYFPGQPVLRGVSLSLLPGEHVAVVGRTGSGKSTLMALVGGLYGPDSGSILVNGRDPRELAEDERRFVVGVVPQTVQLFSGSVMENLTFGDTGVARDAVRRAAEVTGADGFVRALPKGYETALGGIGHGGLQLSTGQRQLLALTRSIVFNPPLLVLDEATSSVDGESDAAFRAALKPGISAGRAVLTVAHRLASAREADRVVVMEGGKIVEEGPAEELVRRGGRFAGFLELEAAGWDWRTG